MAQNNILHILLDAGMILTKAKKIIGEGDDLTLKQARAIRKLLDKLSDSIETLESYCS